MIAGGSTMPAYKFAQMVMIADWKGYARPIAMQNLYNLVQREEEREERRGAREARSHYHDLHVMKLLLVGALSWNPERIRSLCEDGHQLWGVWSRSMAWDQGPYPVTEGCVRQIAPGDAARTILS